MTDTMITVPIDTLDALNRLVTILARVFPLPQTYALVGELGAGKTTFAQVMARHYGIIDHVVSPTFTLVNYYRMASGGQLVHADFYRLTTDVEVHQLGLLEEATADQTLTIIEWADRCVPAVPAKAIWVHLVNDAKRAAIIRGLNRTNALLLEGELG